MIPAFIADIANKKRKQETVTRMQIGDEGNTFEPKKPAREEKVIKAKGGSPPAPNPAAEARAQIELERERAAIAAQQEEQRLAREEAAKQRRIAEAAPKQAAAYDRARGYGSQQLSARGIDDSIADQYGILDLYFSDIDNQRAGIAEDNSNPIYNTNTALDNALGTARTRYRGDLRNKVYGVADDGFEYEAFADTADDSILEAILGSRRADAMSTIDAAKARGQLNDVGYSRALGKLDEQGEAGMSELQSIGLGVLGGYRNELRDFRDDTLDRVGTLDFTDPFNFDSFTNRLGTMKNDFTGRLQGDLYKAVGDQSFFDPSSIISSSGSVQGYYNPTNAAPRRNASTNPLLGAFTEEEEDKQKTGVGNAGVF